MKICSFIYLCLLFAAACASKQEPGVLTECGQTLEGDSGVIEYKFDQEYDAGELCAFIIRVPNEYIMFSLESHGINNASDPDAITIHTYNGILMVKTIHLGPPNPITETYIEGQVAVVVFKTWDNSTLGTGFRLSFRGLWGTVNLPGNDIAFNNLSDSPLELPFWQGNDTVVTNNFVILTNGAKAISQPRTNLRLRLSEEFQNPDGNCQEFFWIYTLTSENVYREGVFCDATTDRSVYYTRGLFIIVFRKFPNTQSKGTLSWDLLIE
ncbi:hypothetical protein Ocin01_13431 [Orchesella cincta]|uniref:CUB domain-containing protein n=1 Tax=Orchesella cincta TaxID=48709 RepID=A0A1D2MK29_ORCCI|nr:hypothetical protein Ocin01_13431 [Orchesella cincta]